MPKFYITNDKNISSESWRPFSIKPSSMIRNFVIGGPPVKPRRSPHLSAEVRLWILYRVAAGTSFNSIFVTDQESRRYKLVPQTVFKMLKAFIEDAAEGGAKWRLLWSQIVCDYENEKRYICVFCEKHFGTDYKADFAIRNHMVNWHFRAPQWSDGALVGYKDGPEMRSAEEVEGDIKEEEAIKQLQV